jgi:hypothetical protein
MVAAAAAVEGVTVMTDAPYKSEVNKAIGIGTLVQFGEVLGTTNQSQLQHVI